MLPGMSALRLFIDTNVLIDFFAERTPFYEDASRLLVMREFGDADLWVSAKSFTDVFYVLSKRFESSDIQAAFRESMSWLDVCSVDGGDIAEAAKRAWPDFEDCLVEICAEKAKADFLITRDARGFAAGKIKAMDPAAFFEMLRCEHDITYDTIDF